MNTREKKYWRQLNTPEIKLIDENLELIKELQLEIKRLKQIHSDFIDKTLKEVEDITTHLNKSIN